MCEGGRMFAGGVELEVLAHKFLRACLIYK